MRLGEAITLSYFCRFDLHEFCNDYPPSMRPDCRCPCHEDES